MCVCVCVFFYLAGVRSIASSLTCCQHCGFVYLENSDDTLVCTEAQPYIDFRGKMCYRHVSIPNWSLTGYLKALHAGGKKQAVLHGMFMHMFCFPLIFLPSLLEIYGEIRMNTLPSVSSLISPTFIGMTWEAIYWHVWAACQVFRVGDFSISALETDKYQVMQPSLL